MIYYALNYQTKTVAIIAAYCFEHLQSMFRVGIELPDGQKANAIGHCKDINDFDLRSKNYTVLTY